MRILLALVCLLFPLVSCAANTGFVHAEGKTLVAPDGKRLVLRGINLGNWLVPEGYMFHFDDGPSSAREIDALFNELVGPAATSEFWASWRENYITEADVEALHKAGFNSIRVPFHYRLFESEEGFRLVDRLIGWCRKAGLWVILDMHCAPGGQTGSNIDDSWGYPWLFESEAEQKHTAALWRKIAGHYKNEPLVAGYDLLNEPIPHYPALAKYNSSLEPVYRQITAAIREVDPHHVVIFGGAQWDTNFKVFGKPFDSNAMYTFHKYWTKPERSVIEEYLAFRDLHNVPIWMGESGENTNEWIQTFASLLNSEEIGWTFWPYKKMDATTSVATFGRPTYWDEIVAFGKLPGRTGGSEKRIPQRPTIEHARAALAGLIQNIRFENCKINEGYLAALGMHSPR